MAVKIMKVFRGAEFYGPHPRSGHAHFIFKWFPRDNTTYHVVRFIPLILVSSGSPTNQARINHTPACSDTVS